MSGDTVAPTGPDAEQHAAIEQLVTGMRLLCHEQDTHVILSALMEMYGRVLSACIEDPKEMEKALDIFQKNARGWWIADRGGPFRTA